MEDNSEHISFKVGENTCSIECSKIPKDSLIDIIVRNHVPKDGFYVVKDNTISKALEYLDSDISVIDEKLLKILEYWGVYKSYNFIYQNEKFIRKNLYKPHYSDHEMNTNSYYKLKKINLDENLLKFIKIYNKNVKARENITNNNLLFLSENEPLDEDIKYFNHQIRKISFLFDCAKEYNVNIFVAGGYIFKALMKIKDHHMSKKIPDVDIFFLDSNVDDILLFIDAVRMNLNTFQAFTRSKNVISISSAGLTFEFILRIYRTHSEIIHGFDVDCCCMGFDGKDLYMTERCEYALFNGYNTVNFDLMSPSYEYRLAKYGSRGISVYVPNLEDYNISEKFIDSCYNNMYEYENQKIVFSEYIKVFIEVQNILINYEIDHYGNFAVRFRSLKYGKVSEILKQLGYKSLSMKYDTICNIFHHDVKYFIYKQEPLKFSDYFDAISRMYNDYKDNDNEKQNLIFKGLDLLLFLDKRNKLCPYKNKIEDSCNLISDYENNDPHPYDNTSSIYTLIQYSYNTREYSYIYEEMWAKINNDLLYNLSDLQQYRNVYISDFFKLGKIYHINAYELSELEFDEKVYETLKILTDVDIPRTIEFMVKNPSKQGLNIYPEATGTFNKQVYENKHDWYEGCFAEFKYHDLQNDDNY